MKVFKASGGRKPPGGSLAHPFLLSLVLAGLAFAAAPPMRTLTPDQGKLLLERNALYAAAAKSWKAKKQTEAIAGLQKVLRIEQALTGPWHLRTEAAARNLANVHRSRGEWAEQASYLRQVIEARRRLYGVDDYRTVDARLWLGEALAQQKRTPEQRQALARARDLHKRAAALAQNGEPTRAVPMIKEALGVFKELLGEKHPEYASCLHNLAVAYHVMGDHKAAVPLYERSLAIRKAALGERHPDYAVSLSGLAFLYQYTGHPREALPLSRRASEVLRYTFGSRDVRYAYSLDSLALIYISMREHESALALYRRTLDIRREALGEKHTDYAMCLHNLAALYEMTGRLKAALPLYQKALAIRRSLGERHLMYAKTLHQLGRVQHHLGDHKEALALAEEAVGLALTHLRAGASAQSDRQQFAAAAHLSHQLGLRLSLPEGDCYGHVLAWKGAVLLRQRQRRLFTSLSAGPKTRKAALDLQAVTRQIAALSASGGTDQVRLEKLTTEQERLQAELSKLSAEADKAFKGNRLTPKALSAALPDGAVLVDYYFYRRFRTAAEGKHGSERHLVAFVSRKGKPTARIDLGPADKAEAAAAAWRGLLLTNKPSEAAGAELRKLIWSPLEKHITGASLALISPDAALASVPFAALPGTKKGTYLIEELALAVVPVPQLLPETLAPVDDAKRHKPSLLVVGDVDYDRAGAVVKAAVGGRGLPRGARREWGRLPATFAETAAVSKAFSSLFEGGTITDLGKSKATKAKVRETLQNVRYAHLATHGFFAQPGIKSALGGREKPDAYFGKEGVAGWHPLLLSGIVLSGANREPKAGEEDGVLTALEVSELELPKLELVVLSACETGLGKSAGGEGLLGLQRAFAVAGARTVVASLWAVDDRTTQALMSEFYKAAWDTETIVSRAEALRRAQLSILKEGNRRGIGKKGEKLPRGETRLPPYYWAAFVLSGDWR
jgi:CHAT domain-containing protein/tetratricopeptide (TPR) repeat protein